MDFFLILFFLFIPLIVSFVCQKYTLFNKIGPVLICYAIGLIFGHSAIFDTSTHPLQDSIAEASILIALPILLFDSNPRKWKETAGISLKSMIIAVLSLIFVVAIGHYYFSTKIQDAWKVGGMLIGVYTGGTPNLASIKTALNVSNDVYIAVHSIDTILGALYLLFLLTLGKVWFRKLLPIAQKNEELVEFSPNPSLDLKPWIYTFNYKDAALGLMVSLLIAGISAGIGLQLNEEFQMIVIILLITSLAILFSLSRVSNKLKSSFPVGLYFINVFSLAIASRANFHEIAHLGSSLIYYVSFVLFATFALHFLLSKLLHIDSDTMMITSTALICSPPFVPVIAGSLKNKSLLIPGLTVGIIGYALGNYLGVIFAYILK